MRKILAIYIIVLLCSSCVDMNNYDYPYKVYFNASGGTTEINGSNVPTLSFIEECTSRYNVGYTLISSNDWLTIKRLVDETAITITALPNESKKKRESEIFLSFGPEVHWIRVKQDK